jgi:hypothetical protein
MCRLIHAPHIFNATRFENIKSYDTGAREILCGRDVELLHGSRFGARGRNNTSLACSSNNDKWAVSDAAIKISDK